MQNIFQITEGSVINGLYYSYGGLSNILGMPRYLFCVQFTLECAYNCQVLLTDKIGRHFWASDFSCQGTHFVFLVLT